MAIELIRFSDNTYGIRRRFWYVLWYEYLDLELANMWWWSKNSQWFSDCKCKDYDRVVREFNRLTNKIVDEEVLIRSSRW